MKINELKWDFDAWEDYVNWNKLDKKKVKKINELIKDMQRHPFKGIGKPEQLKENLSGLWSRRIDKENRIVYFVENDCIVILQCKTHYNKNTDNLY
jgi:toxin YoeB